MAGAGRAKNGQASVTSEQEDGKMAKRSGIVREFWLFLKENKAYWLVPILLVTLLLVAVVIAGSTGAAPFIYTLF